jgi:hypothetical protein
MSEQQLRLRLEALGAGPATADWADARDRAARLLRRRTRLVLALAAVTGILVAAPAFALATGVIDFSKAEPAPEETKLLFGELNTGAPAGMAPGVDAKETRAVLRRELFGRTHTLWVAPTKDGGYCTFLLGPQGGGGGGCDRARELELSPGGIQPQGGGSIAVVGSVLHPDATHVDVLHKDGSTTRLDLVWVSPPIDAGFFVAEIPYKRNAVGFIARDADGNEVARKMAPGGMGMPR